MSEAEQTSATPLRNSALVFLKPTAATQAVGGLVRRLLAAEDVNVLRTGRIDAEAIDRQGLIDVHYGAIASRALRTAPRDLPVQPRQKAEFKSAFGTSWEDALARGLVLNAREASRKLGVHPLQLSKDFQRLPRGRGVLRLGAGLYVGLLGGVYVVNGFYEGMRAKFTSPGSCIEFFEVEWDPLTLPWEQFRRDVVGATDPRHAAAGSIRGAIFRQWRSLGLPSAPDLGDNALHASASAFEGLAEKANWLGVQVPEDPLGQRLLAAGLERDRVEAWMGDPPVYFGGKRRSLFDLMEGLDARECVQMALSIQSSQ